jgi:hypothetical protein
VVSLWENGRRRREREFKPPRDQIERGAWFVDWCMQMFILEGLLLEHPGDVISLNRDWPAQREVTQ